jgi:hypothetical protein
MAEKIGVNLIPYMLTPAQAVLIELFKIHPWDHIEIELQDAQPMIVFKYTSDGLGKEKISIQKTAEILRIDLLKWSKT